MFKKFLIIILLFLITCLMSVKAGVEEMYLAIYDKDLNHITNVVDVKYNITKRVYDFDTSNFEGTVDTNIEKGFIFSFSNASGKQQYAGFLKNIKQVDNQVSFKGNDLRKVFDTDITLDYSKPLAYQYSYYLFDIFKDVSNAVKTQQTPTPVVLNFSYPTHTGGDPATWISTSWIANYAYQYLVKNAHLFLKVYLSYYNYYIDASFNANTKSINYEFKKNTSSKTIRLDDFVYQKTSTEIKVNKSIAMQKYITADNTSKMWIPTDVNYYDMMSAGEKTQTNGQDSIVEKWAGPANNYDIGHALKLDVYYGSGQYWYTDYYQVSNAAIERPDNLKQKAYYLGNDNQIYEEIIPSAKVIFPVNSKIFENDHFNMAQYDAIMELVNNRYNENIIITDDIAPIDIKKIELYEMITVYDKHGAVVTMPVSEIEMSNDSYSIKLGFKKTLFTEVIKNG